MMPVLRAVVFVALGLASTTPFASAAGQAPTPPSARTAVTASGPTTAASGEAADEQRSSAAYRETFEEAWRIIDETHFDPQFNGVDWGAVRDELLPRAEAAGSMAELRAVINEMLSRLNQSHFALWPREALGRLGGADGGGATTSARSSGDAEPGFGVALVDEGFVVSQIDAGGPAAAAGVQLGWLLEDVDGIDVTGSFAELAQHVDEHKARVEAQRGVASYLRGAPGSEVAFGFRDASDRRRELALSRVAIGEVTKFGNMPPLSASLESEIRTPDNDLDVGVIRFNIWLPLLARPFDEAIDEMRDVDGVVLDLRGNPGGLGGMVMGIGGHFVEEQVSLGTMKTRQNELQFVANPRLVDTSGMRVDPLAVPLAILVDNTSASTSEVFAAGLQAAGRARVFGQRSMGAVLPSMMDRLPNGDVLQHAFADFIVTQTGERLEGRGVIPDDEVRVTRQDFLDGRDPILDAAVEWIAKRQ